MRKKTNGKSSAYYVSETVHDSSNNTDSSDGKPRNAPQSTSQRRSYLQKEGSVATEDVLLHEKDPSMD